MFYQIQILKQDHLVIVEGYHALHEIPLYSFIGNQ